MDLALLLWFAFALILGLVVVFISQEHTIRKHKMIFKALVGEDRYNNARYYLANTSESLFTHVGRLDNKIYKLEGILGTPAHKNSHSSRLHQLEMEWFQAKPLLGLEKAAAQPEKLILKTRRRR